MFQNILVPIDVSDRNERAIAMAADLARLTGGKIRLFHVIETIPGIDLDDEAEFFGRLEAKAREILLRHGRRLREAGVDWDSEIVYGSRGQQIVTRAEAMEADLVLMSSHRVDPDRPGGGWGTLSYQVAILAPCSVLLVK